MNIVEALKIVGSLAGLIALGWKVAEELSGYLRINVEVQYEDGNSLYTIHTAVENLNQLKAKRIDNAFLVISPEEMSILDAGKQIASVLKNSNAVGSTNDFGHFFSNLPIYTENGVAFIPLHYYYSENIRIGDEKLTYRCSVARSKLKDGTFSVRFFVFAKGRYHRSTQDLICINEKTIQK